VNKDEVIVRTSDLWSRDHRFDSGSSHYHVMTTDTLFTQVPQSSPNSVIWYQWKSGHILLLGR